MTNRSRPGGAGADVTSPDGSCVRPKSRFRRYSVSWARARPFGPLLVLTAMFVLSGLCLLRLHGFAMRGDGFSFCPRSALLSAAFLEACAQARHEIEDSAVGGLSFRLPKLGLLPLHLRLDDSHQIRPIFVGVASRVEGFGQVPDELLRHLQFLRANGIATREVELTPIDK